MKKWYFLFSAAGITLLLWYVANTKKRKKNKSMYIPPYKTLAPSITKINALITSQDYKFSLSNHRFDGQTVALSKGDGEFLYSVSYPIVPGVQRHEEFRFPEDAFISLSAANNILFITGQDILVSGFKYDDENMLKHATGKITSLATVKGLSHFDNNYLRCIVPLREGDNFSLNDFAHKWYNHPHGKSADFLTVNVEDNKIDFFRYTTVEGNFICFDCHEPALFKDFQKQCFSILLAYGFLKGRLIHDEAFFMVYKDIDMVEPLQVAYISMRGSIITQQPVFTTNAYGIHSDIEQDSSNATGLGEQEWIRELSNKLLYFPADKFSNLVTLLYKNEKLQRSALIYLQSHIAALEVRLPNYYVALEAITGHIAENATASKNQFNPISDKKVARKFIDEVLQLAKKTKSDYRMTDDEFNLNIIAKNIERLNAPPNADKLGDSFTKLGYMLSKEEKNLLKDRNRYLHGSFLKTVGHQEEFREALHVALRLHFMIAVLLLKLAGFSGYIINYAEAWSYMTGRQIGEDRLRYI
ncbi:hypothetical protein OGH69_14480 [Flavobacterium sp. MFBS3-15]|uniref:hypothetical protein n=1 Tax=Flavobacterium sp. MFBS3-15 TaxID=2989816 RepID=UPI0022360279|nr:hypothetical protein [Flavobacterium sp. MFBS3-15]MCW4470181.1 hypothetical protein [Flavobacterium sp. MFBS3-15]